MYHILAFYQFSSIEDPREEIRLHKEFFKNRDIKARIYISEEGINGQLSASLQASQEYRDWMHSKNSFCEMHFKIHTWHEHAFPRQCVKYRHQIVALDAKVDLLNRGEYVSPNQWKEMLEKKDAVLIDVRNDYEWKVGHFEGAELPNCKTFREFKHYAEELKERIDPDSTPIMMYCTGGIRCEVYSSYLKNQGFENVYQLQGGVINYGLEVGSQHWKGKLFVFDDRLAISISDEEAPIIGECHHCQRPCDHYYNCANMDCNELFLCCPECLKLLAGCCRNECQTGPRVRPYHHQKPHKPFRKRYQYGFLKNIFSS